MQLFLARHGEAASKSPHEEPSLTDNGIKNIEDIAHFLSSSNLTIAQVFHSGKRRAEQTAHIFHKKITANAPISKLDNICPLDSPELILQEINTWSKNTLLVGHLPYMSNLASLLTSGNIDPYAFTFDGGSILCLNKESSQAWTINWMLSPKLF